MVFSLSYVSRSLIEAHSVEMLDIVRASLKHNAADGVCGALYFDDAQFFQVLEGPRTAVEATFARILTDRRHHDVTLLSEGQVPAPLFAGAPMKFLDGAWLVDGRKRFDFDRLRAASGAEVAGRIEVLRAA